MDRADQLLQQFVITTDDSEARGLLERLINEHADRVIRSVVLRTTGVRLAYVWRLADRPARGMERATDRGYLSPERPNDVDAEEVYFNTIAALVEDLWRRKDGATGTPIRSFAAYTAVSAANQYRQLM